MRVNDLIPYGSLAGKVASILNYTMTYKDKVFTKELYDNESEEFQKIALEAQKVGTHFGLYTSNRNNGIKYKVKEEIEQSNLRWKTF